MRRSRAVALAFLIVALPACSRDDGRTMRPPYGNQTGTIGMDTTTVAGEIVSPGDASSMSISGPWLSDGPIEAKHTCAGDNVSPPLSWSNIPAGTVTLALVLTDEDAPTFVHWVIANIPPGRTGLAAGEVVPTASSARNSMGKTGYFGPCPPAGRTHTYTLTLYAVSQQLEVLPGDPADQMTAAIESAAIDVASTSFTFSR